MSEPNNTGDKPLSVGGSKTLSLKRPSEPSMVRQSFSHGRSKAVVVEKVKRRVPGPGERPVVAAPVVKAPAPKAPVVPVAPAPVTRVPEPRPVAPRSASGVVLRTLTEDERAARERALVDARSREEDERRRAETDSKLRAERDARERQEREAAEARKRTEEERLAKEAEARRKSEDEARRRLPQDGETPVAATGDARSATSAAAPASAATTPAATTAGAATPRPILRRPMMPVQRQVLPPSRTPRGPQKDRGRLTVTSATGSEEDERTRSVAAFRRRVQRMKGGQPDQRDRLSREVVLPETITIQELANRMSERAVDVIRLLMREGQDQRRTALAQENRVPQVSGSGPVRVETLPGARVTMVTSGNNWTVSTVPNIDKTSDTVNIEGIGIVQTANFIHKPDGAKQGLAVVHVKRGDGSPLSLVLSSRGAVRWTLMVERGAVLKSIMTAGPQPCEVVGAAVPVIHITNVEASRTDTPEYESLQAQVARAAGARIRRFQGVVEGNEFTVDGR